MKNGYVLVNKISKSYFRFRIRIKSPKVKMKLDNRQNLQKYFQNSNTIKSLIRKNNMENENS